MTTCTSIFLSSIFKTLTSFYVKHTTKISICLNQTYLLNLKIIFI
ncbi:hypothetical protein IGI43_003260 [Enterococcus sp. AZ126]